MIGSEVDWNERVDIMAQSFFESRDVPPAFPIGYLLHPMQIFLFINTSASLNLRCLGSSNLSLFTFHDPQSSCVAAASFPLTIQEDCHTSGVIHWVSSLVSGRKEERNSKIRREREKRQERFARVAKVCRETLSEKAKLQKD